MDDVVVPRNQLQLQNSNYNATVQPWINNLSKNCYTAEIPITTKKRKKLMKFYHLSLLDHGPIGVHAQTADGPYPPA